ncbi:beta-galactosidase GalB [Novipirellula aureliae]|nr:beta-galactosidase GalB [Novipirellula aureliae]
MKNLLLLLATLAWIPTANASYTETMDPHGLTKNLVTELGMVDDNGQSNQSDKLQKAIDTESAGGGGILFLPKGTYSFGGITMKSNVHLLIENDTVIKPYWPTGTKTVVFSLDGDEGHIENVSIRGVGGKFIVDYSDRGSHPGEGIRTINCRGVRNFLISDLLVKDSFTTYCAVIFTPVKTSGTDKPEVSGPTDGLVMDLISTDSSPGYGLVQMHGGERIHFMNLAAYGGGVTFRLETGAGGEYAGIRDITAKNIYCENGLTAVMLGPHTAQNGMVKIDGVKAKSCAWAVKMGSGFVEKKHEGDPKFRPGRFADGTTVKNIHAIFGTNAAISTKGLGSVPKPYLKNLRFDENDRKQKRVRGPSIGVVRDGTEGSWVPVIENVSCEGFEYNQGVVKGGKEGRVNWKEWMAGTPLLKQMEAFLAKQAETSDSNAKERKGKNRTRDKANTAPASTVEEAPPVSPSVSVAESGRETIVFNEGWRFERFGWMPDGSLRAEPQDLQVPSFDDSSWRVLNLPHDWGIEGPFRDDLPNRTGKLPWAGIGWYRKSFPSHESDASKRIFIEFDGAMSGTSVWLNGEFIGEWPYGYSSFRFELTDHLHPGERNTIAVRLDNKPESSRWYPGGGIYRNVRIVKCHPVHIGQWGVAVTTPTVTHQVATVQISTEVEGADESTKVQHEVRLMATSEVVANQPGANCTIQIDAPKLWDLATPNLYVLKTTINQDDMVVDVVETTFGIRSIEFDADRGFLLNGKVVRMNGVCQHHDLGPLGSAVNTRAMERQIEILQSMGCNAIRTSHNPPAPELLDLCDRMGMLVQVEAFDCWKTGKIPNDYSLHFPQWHEKDLRAMVRRDRNHPCVVMWSTGNEIREQNHEAGHAISQRLTDIVRTEDPTRPVTAGCNMPAAGFNGFEKTIDLFGYNYKPQLYGKFRQTHPDQPLYGSETASTVSSRGEYFFPVSNNKSKGSGGWFQVSSYDLSAPPWANNPDIEFTAQDRFPGVFGEFVWTGFDYLGEPTPYNNDATNLLNFSDPEARQRMETELKRLGDHIPPRSSYFGMIDLCGFPKDRFYLYQARWRPELPMAHILPHWNWPNRIGKVTPVHVYTSGDEAELFLNGKSLGRRKKGEYEYRLRWDEIVYEPGELKVVTYNQGKPWAESSVKTTDDAAKIELVADRTVITADGRDLSFVRVQVSDIEGLLVPRSDNRVRFTLEGPGEIIAVGNGDPTSHESFQAVNHKVFNGLCLVVVRSKKNKPGDISLTAESDGLRGHQIKLKSTKKRKGLNRAL